MIAIQLPTQNIHSQDFPWKNDESLLVGNLRAGCKETFGMFYNMYSAALLGILVRIVKSDEVAEDLLQETFIKIWNSIDKFDNSKGRLFTWMASMTRNLAIDHLRSRAYLQQEKRSPIEALSPEQFTQHQTAINPDLIGLKKLAYSLKGPEREVLDLIYFQAILTLKRLKL